MLIKYRLIFLETEKGKDPLPRRLTPGTSDAAPKSQSLLRPPLGGLPLPGPAGLPSRPGGSSLELLTARRGVPLASEKSPPGSSGSVFSPVGPAKTWKGGIW